MFVVSGRGDGEFGVAFDEPLQGDCHTRGVGIVEALHVLEGIAEHVLFSQALVVNADDPLVIGETRHRSGTTMQTLDGHTTRTADFDVCRRAEAIGDTFGEARGDDGAVPEAGIATARFFHLGTVGIPLGLGLAGLHQYYDFLLGHSLILRCRVWNTRASFQSLYPM
jgi:hypothetical protein